MENIEIKITKQDKELYDLFKYCKNEEMVKSLLNDIVGLYLFSNGNGGVLEGHLTPENYRDRVLKNKTKEELTQMKGDLEKNILLYVSDYHPDECDCGIMRGSDTEYWFIDEDSRLGFMTLYTNYIKMIDEILKEEN